MHIGGRYDALLARLWPAAASALAAPPAAVGVTLNADRLVAAVSGAAASGFRVVLSGLPLRPSQVPATLAHSDTMPNSPHRALHSAHASSNHEQTNCLWHEGYSLSGPHYPPQGRIPQVLSLKIVWNKILRMFCNVRTRRERWGILKLSCLQCRLMS